MDNRTGNAYPNVCRFEGLKRLVVNMRLFFVFVFLLGAIGVAMPAWVSNGTVLSATPPPHDTAQRLVEAWLRFHGTDLCQGVDAVFVFNKT
jgi:hypothetical protein